MFLESASAVTKEGVKTGISYLFVVLLSCARASVIFGFHHCTVVRQRLLQTRVVKTPHSDANL